MHEAQLASYKAGKRNSVGECFADPVDFVIYCDDKNVFWNCLLCRCSVLRNENKFYRIQLRCKDQERFSVFVRRGRISEQGSSKTITCSSLEQAKCTFLKLFFEKTGRCWETHYFNDATNVIPALPFKYAIVHLHRQLPQPKTRSSKSQGYSAGNLVADSTLSKPVQDVISIICPIKLVDDSGIVQERDTSSNAPIGELSEEQIRLGYESLERIKSCLELNKSRQELCRACDQYYTLIPHAFSRSSHIPMVDSTARLISEFCYLTSLERTTTLVPIDVAYNYLQCKIVALNKDSVEYQTLSRSFHTTHAKIDNQFDVSVEQIFELSKPREQLTFKNCGNRRLLWHGSPLNNHAGILERGLRVAPIEAVCSGYMAFTLRTFHARAFDTVARLGNDRMVLCCWPRCPLDGPTFSTHVSMTCPKPFRTANTVFTALAASDPVQ